MILLVPSASAVIQAQISFDTAGGAASFNGTTLISEYFLGFRGTAIPLPPEPSAAGGAAGGVTEVDVVEAIEILNPIIDKVEPRDFLFTFAVIVSITLLIVGKRKMDKKKKKKKEEEEKTT